MKKTIQIIIGIIAFLGIVAISKNHYIFSSADEEFIDKGWEAYKNKDYNYAITKFNLVNINKHPELLQVLGECYYQLDSINETIHYLEKALVNSNLNQDELVRVQNQLGICYTQKNNFHKAKYYLKKSQKLQDSSSIKLIHFIDSLEQLQNKNLNTSK